MKSLSLYLIKWRSKRRKSKVVTIFLFALLCANTGYAKSVDSDEIAVREREEIWRLVDLIYAETTKVAHIETPISNIRALLNKSCDRNFPIEDNQVAILQLANYWDNNYGVELRGGLTSGDLDSSDVDNDGLTYLELSWDMLSNGMKEFDHRAMNLRRKAAVEKMQDKLRSINQQAQCRHINIHNAFGGTLANLYNTKLELIEPVLAIEQRAYFTGLSYLDELLISQEQVVTLRLRLQKLLSSVQQQNLGFSTFHPGIVDINIEQLMTDVRNDTRFAEIASLDDLSSDQFNPYRNGNRLRVFLRKEFDVLSSNRDDTVVGLRFSLPINFMDKPSYQSSTFALQREAELELWERENRVRVSYNEYIDQLERTITQHYRYVRSAEKMRRVLNRKADGQDLVLSAVVVRALNHVDALTELIEAKHELFKRFNRVLVASRLPFQYNYVMASDITNKQDRVRPFNRGIYLWSESFNGVDNSRLTKILDNQQLETIYLSYSKKLDRQKAKTFIDFYTNSQTNASNKVKLIIGDNSWFKPENHEKAASSVAAVAGLTGHVHLDIEPQALYSYKENKAVFQTQFVDMVQSIRSLDSEVHLSIAVPFHWHPDTYRKLNPLVDEFVLMNYGAVSDDARVRRINIVLDNISKSKLQVAIRPQDFTHLFHMEQALLLINQATGLDHFVLHDFASMIDAINRRGE